MFSRQDQLDKKTGPEGIGRYDYLKQLVEEYKKTKSYGKAIKLLIECHCYLPVNVVEAKKEVLANLANFAYDPINYDHIKRLRILDVFLEQLSENSEELLHFALAGICNLSSGNIHVLYVAHICD